MKWKSWAEVSHLTGDDARGEWLVKLPASVEVPYIHQCPVRGRREYHRITRYSMFSSMCLMASQMGPPFYEECLYRRA